MVSRQPNNNSNNLDNNSNNNNHVVDLRGVQARPLGKHTLTFKLVALVTGIVLGLVLLVQVIMMYSLDAGQEAKRYRRDRESAQHIHPEVLDLALSKISGLALGGVGRKHMEVLRKVASEARRFQQDLEPCDSECARFRELLKTWPLDKPKGAVVILTQASRLHYLKALLEALDTNFLNSFPYPVVLYHEENYRPLIEQVKTFSKADIFFQEVQFQMPDFINISAVPEKACLKGIGYRHMCRFQSKLIYNQPIIAELEYVFRLDDDSMITAPVQYDLFRFMRDNDKLYGYMWELYDAFECTEGLWEATRNYVREHSLQPTFFNRDEWPEPTIFYNNFEISKVEVWNKRSYRDFVDYIDKLGGIYYHRWGDAPIKGLALSLFVTRDKLHRFNDIGYQHSGMVNDPKTDDTLS